MKKNKYKILIYKEKPGVALDLKQMLESKDHYIVDITKSTDETINILKTTIPDILIHSLLLGNYKNYYDYLSLLQKRQRFPVIFIGGTMELKYYKSKLKAESVYFLQKPFSTSELLNLCEGIIKV